MKISVICPTRNRKDILCKGIDSLINFSSYTADVEFLIRFDDDDISTLEEVMEYYETKDPIHSTSITNEFKWGESTFKVIETTSKKHNVSMKFLVGHRHRYHYLNRYYDELMYVSDGEYLVVWTDDLELVPNYNYDGWDVLIEEGKGQNYIFFFRDGLSTYAQNDILSSKKRRMLKLRKQGIGHHFGKPMYPTVVPRKFFEINGRLCPNVLDDWWYQELCKIVHPDVRVILHWGVYHHCLYTKDDKGHVIKSNMDTTCLEGRMMWDEDRELKVKNYEYYNLEEMLKIKEYIDKHPNTKKTTQYHDTTLYDTKFEYSGTSTGRWNSIPSLDV